MTERHVPEQLAERWQQWADQWMAGGAASDGPDVSDLADHLAGCGECRAEQELWASAFGLLKSDLPEPAPAGFVAEVLAALPPSPAPAAQRVPWTGLAIALAACMSLTGAAMAIGLVWAPGTVAGALGLMGRWIGFGLQLMVGLGASLSSLADAYHMLLLTYPAQAGVGAAALVAGCILAAKKSPRIVQTFML